jgi:hypothetical protein
MMPGKVSNFLGFEPATLPLRLALKPKCLARRVFDSYVSYPFPDGEDPERAEARTAHFNPKVQPNEVIVIESHCMSFSRTLVTLSNAWS